MRVTPISLVLLGTSFVPAVFAQAASAQDEGVSISVVSVGKDSPSEGQSIVVGQIARQGFERNPNFAVLDLQRFLEGGQASAAEQRLRAAGEAYRRGRAAYDALELSAALEAFAEALVGYEQAVAALPDMAPLVEVLKYQGAAYALTGDQKNAQRAFKRAITIDPGLSIAGDNFPEEITAIVEDYRDKVERAPRGTLTVYSAPAAAEVWVDGGFRGSAPISVDNLPTGTHYVRVSRAGYVDFGTAVEVVRRAEETVQATLRPTKRFAEFDDLSARLKTSSEQGAADLAAVLKVDQLLWIVVEAAGDDVTVTATLTDGVGGGALATGTKAFVSTSPRYRSDVELWLAQNFRKAQGAQREDPKGDDGQQVGTNDGSSFLPDAPTEAPTSPKTVLGYSLIGIGVIPLGLGIGFGIGSLVPWDAYKNDGDFFQQQPVPHQLHESREDVYNSFLVTSVIADVSYAVAAVMFTVGGIMVWLGANEQEEIEDVLSDARPLDPRPLDGPRMAMEAGDAR